jgi:hypothetical protein
LLSRISFLTQVLFLPKITTFLFYSFVDLFNRFGKQFINYKIINLTVAFWLVLRNLWKSFQRPLLY